MTSLPPPPGIGAKLYNDLGHHGMSVSSSSTARGLSLSFSRLRRALVHRWPGIPNGAGAVRQYGRVDPGRLRGGGPGSGAGPREAGPLGPPRQRNARGGADVLFKVFWRSKRFALRSAVVVSS